MDYNDLKLQDIVVPNLDSSEFGKNIDEQFAHINSNFIKLSNHDFIKGEDGESVELKEIDLSKKNDESILLKDQIKEAIKSEISEYGLSPVFSNKHAINWDDNLSNNPGTILLMYSNENIISSMAYIYIDPRFGNDVANIAKNNDYRDLVDCSCVVYFNKYVDDKPTFIKVNLFPTLYYDDNTSNFCWKIWGQETGLIANGPAGKDAGSGIVNLSDFDGIEVPKVNILTN